MDIEKIKNYLEKLIVLEKDEYKKLKIDIFSLINEPNPSKIVIEKYLDKLLDITQVLGHETKNYYDKLINCYQKIDLEKANCYVKYYEEMFERDDYDENKISRK